MKKKQNLFYKNCKTILSIVCTNFLYAYITKNTPHNIHYWLQSLAMNLLFKALYPKWKWFHTFAFTANFNIHITNLSVSIERAMPKY